MPEAVARLAVAEQDLNCPFCVRSCHNGLPAIESALPLKADITQAGRERFLRAKSEPIIILREESFADPVSDLQPLRFRA